MHSEGKETVALVVVELPLRECTQGAREKSDTAVSSAEREERIHKQYFELKLGDTLRIGRSRGNDLVIFNEKVSRFHAVLSVAEDGVVVSDLSSLNGTLVNGRRISSPVALYPGDVLRIGGARIRVEIKGGKESHSEVSTPMMESSVLSTQAARMAAVAVTVLIADICGYTKLSEALPGQEVAAILHLWFERIGKVVTRYGGEVNKYLGDCVMAVWQAGEKGQEFTATEAVKAALEIRTLTNALSESAEWKYGDKYPWRCRVALNTGEALVGTVGGAGARDFTVLGDTVNVAFRLKKVATQLDKDLVLSGATAERVLNSFALCHLGASAVEGRNEPVEIFAID